MIHRFPTKPLIYLNEKQNYLFKGRKYSSLETTRDSSFYSFQDSQNEPTESKILRQWWQCESIQLTLNQGFTTSAILTLWAGKFCCGRLSCALQDVQQHPCSLPTRRQQHSHSCDNQKRLQTLPHVPWGAKLLLVENHGFILNQCNQKTVRKRIKQSNNSSTILLNKYRLWEKGAEPSQSLLSSPLPPCSQPRFLMGALCTAHDYLQDKCNWTC